jgi:hypothetical protein
VPRVGFGPTNLLLFRQALLPTELSRQRYTWRDLDPQHRVCRTRALTVELQVHRWPIRNSNPGQEIESLLSWSPRRMGRDQCRGLGLNQYALAGAAPSKRCVFLSATTALFSVPKVGVEPTWVSPPRSGRGASSIPPFRLESKLSSLSCGGETRTPDEELMKLMR